jgi:hypothetical protein
MRFKMIEALHAVLDPAVLSLVSLIFAFAGTVLLAYAMNGFVGATREVVQFLQRSIHTIVGNGDIVAFKGLDKRLDRASRGGTRMTKWGVALMTLSIMLQALAIHLQK